MKHYLILFLISLLSQPAVSQNTVNQRVFDYIYNGEQAKAIEWLESKNPDSIVADELLVLMRLYTERYMYSRIIELYRENPVLEGSADARFFLGRALAGLGMRGEAINSFEDARNLEKTHIASRLQLSNIYMDQKSWESALDVQYEIQELMPDNLYNKIQKARALRNSKRESEAINLLTGVLEIRNTYYPAITDLALLHFMDGNNSEGRTLINRGIELYPEQELVWDISARIAFNQRQFRLAAAHWKKALEIGEVQNSTLRNIGLCYYQLNEPDTALQYFTRVLEKDPDEVQSLMYAAIIFRQKKDWLRAHNALDHLYNLQNDEFLSETLVQRAVAREQLLNTEGAVQDYRLASKLNPDNGIYFFYIASLLERNKANLQEIIDYYERFIAFEGRADSLLIEQAKAKLRSLKERMFFRGE